MMEERTHTRKIKLAHVITRMDRGGAPDVVRALCRGLDRERFELSLVTGETRCPSARTKEFLAAFPGTVTVIDSLRRDIDILRDARAYAGLASFFKRERFDLIHTHTAKAGALGRLAARSAGIRAVVHTPHGHNIYGYFNPLFSRMLVSIERRLAAYADRITVLSFLEKEDMVRYGICGPGKIAVIGQGVDEAELSASRVEKSGARAAFNIPEQAFVVGTAARLERVKGAHVFIRAAIAVARETKDAYFIVAGEGSLRCAMEAAAKRNRVADRFRFLGWREHIGPVFSACDVTVLASLNEAAGISLIESQLMGRPVIATRVGGVPEVVRHGETGILIEPGDPDALRAAIVEIMRGSGMRMRMSETATAWARERFCVSAMVRAYRDLYMDIMGALR